MPPSPRRFLTWSFARVYTPSRMKFCSEPPLDPLGTASSGIAVVVHPHGRTSERGGNGGRFVGGSWCAHLSLDVGELAQHFVVVDADQIDGNHLGRCR